MKYCTHCGKPVDDRAKFCAACGSPVQAAPAAVPPAVPAPATVAAPQAMSGETAAAMDAEAAKQKKILYAAIAAVVAVILVFGGLFAYNAWFAGVPVPAAGSAKANDVVAQLSGKGVQVTKTQRYAKEKAGQYLGVEGVQPGTKVRKGQSVVVVESLGPGVPKGTVGEERDAAIAQFKDMGVPVTTYAIVSDKLGTVVASYPSDGHALTEAGERLKGGKIEMPKPAKDQPDGILLAVGVKGDGVPAEVYGMDGAKAEHELEQAGFSVTMQLVPADKDMIGKAVRTDPAIGQESDASEATLYVGADAKDLREAMMTTAQGAEGYHGRVVADFRPLLGKWCRDDGPCVTLAQDDGDQGSNDGVVRSISVTRDGRTQPDKVSRSGLRSHPGDFMSANDWDLDSPNGGLENLLSAGDTGVIDIYDGFPMPYCGSTETGEMISSRCVNGTLVNEGAENDPSTNAYSGTVYRMSEFLLVSPVGADMDAVKQSGYFADAKDLKASKKTADKGDVDEDRPYLLLRDPSLYKDGETEAPCDDFAQGSPFIPTEHGGPRVKFAPAPSAASAYYFVNDGFSWTTFGNGTQVCDAHGCKGIADDGKADKAKRSDAKSSASKDDGEAQTATPSSEPSSADPSPTATPTKKKTAEDMTTSEIRDTLRSGDFSIIAGRYCTHGGSCLVLDDDGSMQLEGSSGWRGLTLEKTGTTVHVTNEERRPIDPKFKDKVIMIAGSDDDYRCFSAQGDVALRGAACKRTGGHGYDTFDPAWMVYYPKGIELNGNGVTGSTDLFNDSSIGLTPPDTSKSFIQWDYDAAMVPVADERVYYLAD